MSISPTAPWHELAFAGEESVRLPILRGEIAALPDIETPSIVVFDSRGTVRWRHAVPAALPRPGDSPP